MYQKYSTYTRFILICCSLLKQNVAFCTLFLYITAVKSLHLVFVEDIAAYFQVCPNTIRNWVKYRRMPHVRADGVGALRIDKEKVIAWAEQNTATKE